MSTNPMLCWIEFSIVVCLVVVAGIYLVLSDPFAPPSEGGEESPEDPA